MSYELAASYYRCDVTPIDALRAEFDEIRKVGELLKIGVDDSGQVWVGLVGTYINPGS